MIIALKDHHLSQGLHHIECPQTFRNFHRTFCLIWASYFVGNRNPHILDHSHHRY